jgi:hypothetical protein
MYFTMFGAGVVCPGCALSDMGYGKDSLRKILANTTQGMS